MALVFARPDLTIASSWFGAGPRIVELRQFPSYSSSGSRGRRGKRPEFKSWFLGLGCWTTSVYGKAVIRGVLTTTCGVSDLEEQIGLKLVSDKGSVEVLVIDSVERPSEN